MPDHEMPLDLPSWAHVGEKRRGHIARVTRLLDAWSETLALAPEERQAWHDAGRLHDALRDAPASVLRVLAEDPTLPERVLHGPAAAARLAAEGEQRPDVLAAIRHHTLGSASFGRTGRALYMADFLEPGRAFLARDRAFLAAGVPRDFDGVFRQVVRMRIEWSLLEGNELYPATVELWNSVR
jgi:2-amino-4-hydroxy-6-hydroxymethyldihydropteridine diphosphokinase